MICSCYLYSSLTGLKISINLQAVTAFPLWGVLDGVTKTYGPGDVVIIPSNTPHSGKAVTACKLMDIFSPVREEYK